MGTSGRPPGPVVVVNNSRETYTPTHSGAIATCVHEVLACAAADGVATHVITSPHAAPPYAGPDLSYVRPPRRRGAVAGRLARARRRATGWAHPDQARFAREAVARLRDLAPAAVICNNDPEVAVAIRRALPEVPLVHWFHNLLVPSDRFRRAFALDSGITSVAVSAYLARAVEQVFVLEPRSVAVALNGVDTARFAPRPEGEEREAADGVPTIGFLGRVAVEKGVDVLLRAALLLARDGVRFRLQVAGDTNWGFSSPSAFRDEVRTLVDDVRGAGVEVLAPGHVVREDVPAVLRATDIHVVPSRWDEPLGLTTLEGLASGLAVVGTATGGTPEVLAGCGVLVPREDPAALAGALRDLLADPARRTSLARAGRARAEGLSWQATWAHLERACGLEGGAT